MSPYYLGGDTKRAIANSGVSWIDNQPRTLSAGQGEKWKMITNYTTDVNKATSLEEMQKIARNQIAAKIRQLEERAANLKALVPMVESVADWASYKSALVLTDVNEDDTDDLVALRELSRHYDWMQSGGYF